MPAAATIPPGGALIHPQTAIGAVHLVVRRLEPTAAFYRERLGFELLDRDAETARLGAGGRPLLVLTGKPDAPTARRTTGLYHFAVLLPSRAELANACRQLFEWRVPLDGASDHLVSEALYLRDPEGNGIEIYRDRPREEWRHGDSGRVAMATTALDVDQLLTEVAPGGPWRMPPGTTVGHVHLRVSDIAAAERFYVDVLGFELTARYGHAASFVSAGGYHHHIGFNTWDSAGAPAPPEGTAGLKWFEVLLPHQAALAAVRGRLAAAGVSTEAQAGGVLVRDPAGNGLHLRAAN